MQTDNTDNAHINSGTLKQHLTCHPVFQDLYFSPAGELPLKLSRGSCAVQIHFSPHQRIRPFIAELQAKCLGLIQPLLTIQGSCQVHKFHCETDNLFLYVS